MSIFLLVSENWYFRLFALDSWFRFYFPVRQCSRISTSGISAESNMPCIRLLRWLQWPSFSWSGSGIFVTFPLRGIVFASKKLQSAQRTIFGPQFLFSIPPTIFWEQICCIFQNFKIPSANWDNPPEFLPDKCCKRHTTTGFVSSVSTKSPIFKKQKYFNRMHCYLWKISPGDRKQPEQNLSLWPSFSPFVDSVCACQIR